jgi:hypothetical protein
MAFHVQTRWGGSEKSPSEERMKAILSELDHSDPEHPDTWLTHESGWTLSAHESGLLIWENNESDAPARHIRDVPRERVLGLWTKLAAGLVAEIDQEPWRAGNGFEPLSDVQRAERDALVLEVDRRFYDSLGGEREDVRCKAPDCSRGAVRASVFCRVHQFENVRGRQSPFSH